MPRSPSGISILGVFTLLACVVSVQAIEMEWVTVGDPGNPHDDIRYGGVAYVYRIGKYEVTNEQYIAFLNAVAREESSVYSTLMTGKSGGTHRILFVGY